MDGIIFLWTMWSIWIIATFFMNKGHLRFFVGFFALLIITTSPFYVSFFTLKINMAFLALILLGSSLFKVDKKRQVLYYVLSTMIISMAYMLYHIYLLYDPAILLIINPWFILIGLVALNRMLVPGVQLRISTLILGMTHGEIMRVMIFSKYIHVMGTRQFLDHFAVAFSLLMGWYVVEHSIGVLEALINGQIRGKIPKRYTDGR